MSVIRIVCLLIIYCSLVNGQCVFHTDEHTIQDKMKNWNVYQNLTVSHNGITYLVGICVSPNNSTAAIIQKENNISTVLGKLDRVNLVGEDNWILLTYGNGEQYKDVCDNQIREASIMLVCGPTKNNLTILQEHTPTDKHCNYMFKLQVPEMCVVEEKSSKLSGGVIFLIIISGLAAVYLVIGALYMRVKHRARGLDCIPNIEMWRRLGNLAADGCDYCCRCERMSPRAGYFLDESGPDMHGDDDILSP